VHFNPYGGAAAALAVALANADPATSADGVLELLREQRYKPIEPVTDEEATTLMAWARRLESIFGDDSRDRQVRLVNELLAEAAAQPYISQHDERPPHLHYAPEDASTADRVKAFTAAGLAHLLCEDGTRLGRCGREGCGVVYVDTSRNGRRRFCSTRCANRVHVAEHRSRRVTL
jgi:hypothetical protein